MRLVLHGLLANLSAGRVAVQKKVGWVKKKYVVFPLVCWLKTSPAH